MSLTYCAPVGAVLIAVVLGHDHESARHPISSNANESPHGPRRWESESAGLGNPASIIQQPQPALPRGRGTAVDQRQRFAQLTHATRTGLSLGQQQDTSVGEDRCGTHQCVETAPIASSRFRCRPRSNAVRARVVTGMPATRGDLVIGQSLRSGRSGRLPSARRSSTSSRSERRQSTHAAPCRADAATPATTPRPIGRQPRRCRPVTQRWDVDRFGTYTPRKIGRCQRRNSMPRSAASAIASLPRNTSPMATSCHRHRHRRETTLWRAEVRVERPLTSVSAKQARPWRGGPPAPGPASARRRTPGRRPSAARTRCASR